MWGYSAHASALDSITYQRIVVDAGVHGKNGVILAGWALLGLVAPLASLATLASLADWLGWSRLCGAFVWAWFFKVLSATVAQARSLTSPNFTSACNG